jgi:hypothetical protein
MGMPENIKIREPHTSLWGLLVLLILAILQLKYGQLKKDPIQPKEVPIDLVQMTSVSLPAASVSDKVVSKNSKQKQILNKPVLTMRRRHKPYFALNWPDHRTSKKSTTALKKTKQARELAA